MNLLIYSSKYKKIIFIFIIILLGFFTRFLGFGIMPPVNDKYAILRILTAGASIINLTLIFLILTNNSRGLLLSSVASIIYLIMPWNIEQSRVYSPSLLLLTVILLTYYLALRTKNYLRLIFYLLGTCAIGIYILLNLQSYNFHVLWSGALLMNLFKLLSGEILFFRNDTFWWGGLRSMGILLPSMIPLFIIGFLNLFKEKIYKYWLHIVFIIGVTLLTLFNKEFPEQRDLFLLSPYLALIVAIGVQKTHEVIIYSNNIIKILLILYYLIILYDHIIFSHFYIFHYSKRIENELEINKIDF